MLPLELLRIKITDKGKRITPLFCSIDDKNVTLAQKLVDAFQLSHNKKEKKANLQEKISIFESEYGDYKLIRGLSTILERRCLFNIDKSVYSKYHTNNFLTTLPSPFELRRILFEESASRGIPTDENQRTIIFDTIASKLNIHREFLEENLWVDQEDNLIIESFNPISPTKLLGSYNLSILQTMLFNCTDFEFSVKKGIEWKYVLRNVKRFGLMYTLQIIPERINSNSIMQDNENSKNISSLEPGNKRSSDDPDSNYALLNNKTICSLDGPLSIFKLTNKYGVLIAKLIPTIISTSTWNIKAWILKNGMAGRKLYQFELFSNANLFQFDIISNNFYNYTNSYESTGKKLSDFDSSVEEKFASQFERLRTGWNLEREPAPLILPDGKVLIADFAFEKYGKKIYFEIIGFWTLKYLERKFKKIQTLIESSNNAYDLFLAINENTFVSDDVEIKKLFSNSIIKILDKIHFILYKNSIPIKHILSYLKSLDNKLFEQKIPWYNSELIKYVTNSRIYKTDIINLDPFIKKYNITIDSISKIFTSLSPDLELREQYILINSSLILKKTLDHLNDEIKNIDNFVTIQKVFEKHKIPDNCHVDLINYLGYELVWTGLVSSDIRIKRKNRIN